MTRRPPDLPEPVTPPDAALAAGARVLLELAEQLRRPADATGRPNSAARRGTTGCPLPLGPSDPGRRRRPRPSGFGAADELARLFRRLLRLATQFRLHLTTGDRSPAPGGGRRRGTAVADPQQR